jgi:hypothetical protein
MKQGKKKLVIGLCLIFTVIFTVHFQNIPLKNWKQVARKQNELTVCDRSLLNIMSGTFYMLN